MVFDTVTILLAPQTVKSVSWDDLQEILNNHYVPKPSHIASQHTFRRRAQTEGETISSYMAALHTAALHCGFRDHLDDMLLEQLVCGVQDLRLQRCLLVKAKLTLKMAIEEAQAAQFSTLSVAEIQGSGCTPITKASVHYDDIYFENSCYCLSGREAMSNGGGHWIIPLYCVLELLEEASACDC
ncbi:hypothetical protein E2320_007753 [Naja naja]|nr:hypothetical protein E2320_007753 [Naja naja]